MINSFCELTEIAKRCYHQQHGKKLSDLRFSKTEYKRYLREHFSAPDHVASTNARGLLKRIIFTSSITVNLFLEHQYQSRRKSLYSRRDRSFVRFGDKVYSDFLSHIDEYELVYKMLSDDLSKKLFLNLLYAKMTCDIDFHLLMGNDFITKEHYNIQLAEGASDRVNDFILPGETFVDCGAYTGDTLVDLLSWEKKPQKYIGFEPDKDNFLKLEKKVRDIGADIDIYIKESGVSDVSGTAAFDLGRGVASQVNESGNDVIQVIALDDVISEPVTLIKMDVEGYEVPALQGAAGLIRKYKPKLAICIYHKPDDFRKIPVLIQQLNPEYSNYYIRHHMYLAHMDTVLYVF